RVVGSGGCCGRRGRHRRLVSDWSSDVCSSDLLKPVRVGEPAAGTVTTRGTGWPRRSSRSETPPPLSANQNGPVGLKATPQGLNRSEERRVGKESGSRWARDEDTRRGE